MNANYDRWLSLQEEEETNKRYPDNAEERNFIADIYEGIDSVKDVLIGIRDQLNKNKHYPDVYIDIVTAVDCCCNALDNLEEYE